MLDEKQVTELFERLKQKYGDSESEEFFISDEDMSMLTPAGKDLLPDDIRDYSDHFDIPVEMIRTFSCRQIDLLLSEYIFSGGYKLPFEIEQQIAGVKKEIEQVGAAVYLEKWLNGKTKKHPSTESPLLPNHQYR